MTTQAAKLVEIFSSIQGEGLRLGERQTFVRFQGCSLKCRWCDTPENFNYRSEYRIEETPFSGLWNFHPNLVSANALGKWLEHFSDLMVSLTGGEPLEQIDFLKSFLPEYSQKFKFLLETSGVLPEALLEVLPWIYTVSMDIKLPSSAQTGEFWKEHEAFIKIARKAPEFYVKIVVTDNTDPLELDQALHLVANESKDIPVILQPASQTRTFKSSPSMKTLADLSRRSNKILPGIRVIPQTHKILGVS